MILSDIRIGSEFVCSDRRWRCTDVGSRLVVAIRVDDVTIARFESATGERGERVIRGGVPEREGWFNGPPYPVAEVVFDEDDLAACEPVSNTHGPEA